MAQRDMNKPLTSEEMRRVEAKIVQLRQEFGFKVGDPLTYEMLNKGHKWVYKRLRYGSDSKVYGKDDHWNTMAFYWMLLDDYLDDDCDGEGYVHIGMLLLIFKVNSLNVCRVACQTEGGEGHFVAWVKADDGIWYQTENRIQNMMTVKAMRERGYEYWHYSTMAPRDIKPGKWYDAGKKAREIASDTPLNGVATEAEEPNMTVGEIINKIPHSRQLQYGTGYGAAGAAAAVSLASQSDWKVVAIFGFFIAVGVFGFFYTRYITTKSLITK